MQVSIACSKPQLFKKGIKRCERMHPGFQRINGPRSSLHICHLQLWKHAKNHDDFMHIHFLRTPPSAQKLWVAEQKNILYISKQYRNHLITLYIHTAVCTEFSPIFFDPALTQLCQKFRFALWWPAWLVDKLKPQNAQFLEGTPEELVRPSNSPWPCPFRTLPILYIITHTTQPLYTYEYTYVYHIQPSIVQNWLRFE